MCSLSSLNRVAALCAIVATASSCNTCGSEPLGDIYVVRNNTSSSYISFSAPGSITTRSYAEYEHYFAAGEEDLYETPTGEGCIKGDPEKVWAVISNRDSVIEIVPKLMTADTCYSIFSGLEDWYVTRSGRIYDLPITDDVVTFITDRMRSQGLPPYRIVRDEIINKSSDDVTITTMSQGTTLNVFRVTAGDTVVLPDVGLLFDGDHYKLESSKGAYEYDGCVVWQTVSLSSRIGCSNEGVRRFYMTEDRKFWQYPL